MLGRAEIVGMIFVPPARRAAANEGEPPSELPN
jgi:hypothetical protein